MKKIIASLFFALLVFSVNAQRKDIQSIEAAVESLRKAMIDADSSVLNKIIDNELMYGHSGGKVENKASFIASLLNGNSDFVTINLTDQKIVLKKNIAIVHHTLSATNNDGGKPGTVKLAIMLTWVKEGKSWKLLSRQAVKV